MEISGCEGTFFKYFSTAFLRNLPWELLLNVQHREKNNNAAGLLPILPWTHTSLLHLLLRLPSLDLCSPSGRSAPGRFYSGRRWTASGEKDVRLRKNFSSWTSDGCIKPERLLRVQEFSIRTAETLARRTGRFYFLLISSWINQAVAGLTSDKSSRRVVTWAAGWKSQKGFAEEHDFLLHEGVLLLIFLLLHPVPMESQPLYENEAGHFVGARCQKQWLFPGWDCINWCACLVCAIMLNSLEPVLLGAQGGRSLFLSLRLSWNSPICLSWNSKGP